MKLGISGWKKDMKRILKKSFLIWISLMDELRASDLPVKVRGVKPYVPGTVLESGCKDTYRQV